MLTKIKVYGPLRKFCNNQRYFEAMVEKPIDAISFLKCNFKGLEKHMADQHYCIKVRGEEISEKGLTMKKEWEIQIIPIAHGNFFWILLGVGALFGGSAISGGFLATALSSVLTTIGTSLVIDSELLICLPHLKQIIGQVVAWTKQIPQLLQAIILLQGFQMLAGRVFQ